MNLSAVSFIAIRPETIVFLSVCLTHEFVDLVRQQCSIDRRDLEDSGIVAPSNILKKWMPALLVQSQNRRHVFFQRFADNGYEGFALD